MIVSVKGKYRDRIGNLYDENDKLIQAFPKFVDDMHFYCIICKDVKNFNEEGGVIASIKIGGWMGKVHQV
jgi:hypothetical protein